MTTGRGKEDIEHSIMSGVAMYTNGVEQPDNSSEQRQNVPIPKTSLYLHRLCQVHVLCGQWKSNQLTLLCIGIHRDTIPDEEGIYRGWSFQRYGNKSPIQEVLLMESKHALHFFRTEITNKVTNIGVYYELSCDCTLKNYNNGYI
jgi:hypothetical protein